MFGNLDMTQLGVGTTSFGNEGQQAPDVVGALRIDQAWGYAQVTAALHDASGGRLQQQSQELHLRCGGNKRFGTGATAGIRNVSNYNPDYDYSQGVRAHSGTRILISMPVDVLWTHLNTAQKGTATLASPVRPAPTPSTTRTSSA